MGILPVQIRPAPPSANSVHFFGFSDGALTCRNGGYMGYIYLDRDLHTGVGASRYSRRCSHQKWLRIRSGGFYKDGS